MIHYSEWRSGEEKILEQMTMHCQYYEANRRELTQRLEKIKIKKFTRTHTHTHTHTHTQK